MVEQAADGAGESLGFVARMWAEAAAVQPLGCGRWDQILLRQGKVVRRGEWLSGHDSAANPQQAGEVDAGGRGRFGMERIGDVDPGADFSLGGELGEEGEREGGAAGAFRAHQLGDGTEGEAAVENAVDCGDTGGGDGAEDARCGGKGGRNAGCQRRFDLSAECGGGRHIRLIFAYTGVVLSNLGCTIMGANG
jgi:hypothetical protein